MFTTEERTQLRSGLLEYAANDGRISGAAITGSGAADREDQWSDIDLAFGVKNGADLLTVLADWTSHMYERHLALTHMDVRAGAWIYRVFFLSSTLQVDLAFVPASEFRALAPTFRLMFGEAKEPGEFPVQPPGDIVGFGWLYALHVRSCICRGQVWQAEYMISGLRDSALALACLRRGLPAVHGRGMDLLPGDALAPFDGSLVRRLDTEELSRAFCVVIHGFLGEVRNLDAELARRLHAALMELAEATSQT